jgi:hypothetical protein
MSGQLQPVSSGQATGQESARESELSPTIDHGQDDGGIGRRPIRKLSRRPAHLVVIIAVLALLAVGGYMAKVGLDSHSTASGSSHGQQNPQNRADPRRPPVGSPTIPPAMAGAWSGQAKQQSDAFSVHVKLVKGATSGAIRYSGVAFFCAGTLRLVSSAGAALTMRQGITVGKHSCADGTVKLRPGPSGSLLFRFTGAAGPAAIGSLTRQ